MFEDKYEVATPQELFETKFAEFMKLAVPKALISRAFAKDWILDVSGTYRAFEFVRAPDHSEPYTMVHYVLHFRRCEPSRDGLLNPNAIPPFIGSCSSSGFLIESLFIYLCFHLGTLDTPKISL